MLISHHSLVPDKTHSLLHSVGSLWDQGEVIFTDCFLGGAVCAVSAAHHLEVPAASRQQNHMRLSVYHSVINLSNSIVLVLINLLIIS